MENLNVDETKVGKFLYEVVKMAMVSGKEIHQFDVYKTAFEQKLLSQDDFDYCILYKGYNSTPQTELFKKYVPYQEAFKEMCNRRNLNEKTEYNLQEFTTLNTEKMYYVDALMDYFALKLSKHLPLTPSFKVNPDYFFNIIDIDELRFARQQAQKAETSAAEAKTLATKSLNWTFWSLVASVVFSLASILITLFNQNPVSIDSKQNKVTIEPKQIEEMQKKMDNISKQYQQQIEKLTQKLDSSQKKK